jgi:hypothetical protein
MIQSRRAVLGVIGCAALLLAACTQEVAREQVEKGAQESLTRTVGKQAPPISCPAGLKGTVGATLTCTMTLDGKPYDVAIKVNSVEGTKVKYDVEVAKQPRG